MNYKITAIIPTYNRSRFLPRALHSVLDQTHPVDELIVVDDGSTDNTLQTLADFEEKNHSRFPSTRFFRVITSENRGVSAARNLAAREASGDWLAFLDSDDEWLPEKTFKQIQYLESSPNEPLIHGEEIWIRNGRRVNPMKKHKKSGGSIFAQCLPLCCISPSATMIQSDLFKNLGGFREDFPVCEDYDLWLKVCSENRVGFIEDPIIKKYGGHEDQLSQKFFAMDYWRLLALHPFLKSEKLDLDLRQKVAVTMKEKAQILLVGYEKHNNLDNYAKVEKLLLDAISILES
tara:strand:- start:89154 stop:90023 length:870 start_codon:yes stop_codon:yes gene_type:complete